jgi:hypothetical protein
MYMHQAGKYEMQQQKRLHPVRPGKVSGKKAASKAMASPVSNRNLSSGAERSIDQNRKLLFGADALRAMLAGDGNDQSWEARVSTVSDYLAGNRLKIGMPADDCPLFIKSCIQRGNEHEAARDKCWKHILIELNCIAGLENCAPADLTKEGRFYLDITSPLEDGSLQQPDNASVQQTEKKPLKHDSVAEAGAAQPLGEVPLAQEEASEFKFDSTSTEAQARFLVRESKLFKVDTIFRQRDRGGGSAQKGVTLVMGYREDNGKQEVVSILFDRSQFTQDHAAEWWATHRHRFSMGVNPAVVPPSGDEGA